MAITKITTPELFDFSSLNTALQLPTGDTGSRPSLPSTGEWRYNTTLKYVEYWDSTAWRQIDTEAVPLPPSFPAENFNTNTYFGTGAAQTLDAKFNEAANFNGTNSLITLDNSLDSTLGVNDFSYSFWVKGPMPSSFKVLISLCQNSFVYLGYNEGGTGGLMISNYNTYFTSNITISADTWTHVGFAKSSANGILITKNGTSTTPYTDTTAGAKADLGTTGSGIGNVIGDYSNGGLDFEGFIDQVRFYNAALDSSDFNYIYTNETTTTASELTPSGFPSGCIAAYQLDGNATDVSGTYSGTVSNVGFTGLQFQPDFVWTKSRSFSNPHYLYDSVRGATFSLSPNATSAENESNEGLNAINSNGFTVGTAGIANTDAQKYVAWSLKAGGAPGATNNNNSGAMAPDSVSLNGVLQSAYTPSGSPTIYPQKMSINTESGFSTIEYKGNGGGAGNTVPHGLSVAPDMVIIKNITDPSNWPSLMRPYMGGQFNTTLALNNSGASTNAFNNTLPTSTLVTLGADGEVIGLNNNIIMYNFHSVNGYLRVGTYTGDASTSGNIVYNTNDATATGDGGFEPAFLMIKAATSTGEWVILDNKRNPSNPRNTSLLITSVAETTGSTSGFYPVNFLTNGFEPLQNTSSFNASGVVYSYIAIAG